MSIKVCVGAKLNRRFISDGASTIIEYPEIHLEYPAMIDGMKDIINENPRLIIMTNSPYIVDIVDVLSRKCDCRFVNYIDRDGGEDCTDSLENLYEIMARPLQDLENMRYSFEDEDVLMRQQWQYDQWYKIDEENRKNNTL